MNLNCGFLEKHFIGRTLQMTHMIHAHDRRLGLDDGLIDALQRQLKGGWGACGRFDDQGFFIGSGAHTDLDDVSGSKRGIGQGSGDGDEVVGLLLRAVHDVRGGVRAACDEKNEQGSLRFLRHDLPPSWAGTMRPIPLQPRGLPPWPSFLLCCPSRRWRQGPLQLLRVQSRGPAPSSRGWSLSSGSSLSVVSRSRSIWGLGSGNSRRKR